MSTTITANSDIIIPFKNPDIHIQEQMLIKTFFNMRNNRGLSTHETPFFGIGDGAPNSLGPGAQTILFDTVRRSLWGISFYQLRKSRL